MIFVINKKYFVSLSMRLMHAHKRNHVHDAITFLLETVSMPIHFQARDDTPWSILFINHVWRNNINISGGRRAQGDDEFEDDEEEWMDGTKTSQHDQTTNPFACG